MTTHTRPVIGVTGRPAWLAEIEPLIKAAGFTTQPYDSAAEVITRLADDHAALLLVDGRRADWPMWTSAPKTSPATRRIPVLVVGTAIDAAEVLSTGADGLLAAADLSAELPGWLAEHARLQDPTRAAQLASQCAEPLPPFALEGIAKFNAGDYYPQHDVFEALWMAEDGPVRDLYRAILQVGVAYYQVTRGNRRGALKMLLRSLQWLAVLPDVCRGVDVAQLRADSAQVRVALEAVDDLAAFDLSLLKPVRLVDEPPA